MQNIDLTLRQLLTAPENAPHLIHIGLFLSWYEENDFNEEMWQLLTAAIGSHYFDGEFDANTRENLVFTLGGLMKFTASIAELFKEGASELYASQVHKKNIPPSDVSLN